jgi:hypothetical protein
MGKAKYFLVRAPGGAVQFMVVLRGAVAKPYSTLQP